jgi:ABC-2 type transport system permease protein
LIPLPHRYLAYLSPTTYAAEIVQSVTGRLTMDAGMMTIDWLVLAGITVSQLVLTARKARWREV